MAAQKQDDQLERTFSSYVRIQAVVLKTYLGRWTIGRSGERGSGISVLPAWYDDDDEVSSSLQDSYQFSDRLQQCCCLDVVSSCPPISKFSNPFTNLLGIVPRAKITIGITVSFMFHYWFSSSAALDIHLSFRVICCCMSGRQRPLFGRFFFCCTWQSLGVVVWLRLGDRFFYLKIPQSYYYLCYYYYYYYYNPCYFSLPRFLGSFHWKVSYSTSLQVYITLLITLVHLANTAGWMILCDWSFGHHKIYICYFVKSFLYLF